MHNQRVHQSATPQLTLETLGDSSLVEINIWEIKK
jgi:hypothetical protein